MMKSQGVQPGESDIAILLPRDGYGSFLMEYKATDGTHPTSDEQIAYVTKHLKCGNSAKVVKGLEEAKQAITRYMAGDVVGQD